ncbi:MAG: ribokinase [Clostridia bacterium]|nr:ribokinase [Clostridia bacterium]
MKILNFGSLNADYVYEMPHILLPGETLTSLSRNTYPGGKGLNSTVALAKAGANVFFAGTLGTDGDFLLDTAKDAGADVSLITRVDAPSGHTVIQVDDAAENCILVFPGSNRMNTEVQIDDALSHFESGDILILQNEVNNLPYLMEKAKQRGMTVVFNPSPCDEIIATLPLDKVDYLVVNKAEAATLAGESNSEPLESILQKLHGIYPHAKFVVTLGGEGALYYDGSQTVRQECFPADAVDTTGAGDTFLGNFVTGLSEGMDPAECLRLAAAAASIAVSRKGAASSIPTRQETERKLMF